MNPPQLTEVTEDDVDMFSYKDKVMDVKITSVYDGDTFTGCFYEGGVLKKYKFRCEGYDSEEMRQARNAPNRDQAKQKARDDKQHFIDLIDAYSNNTRVIQCLCGEFDKYGRILVKVPADGSINNEMITSGHGYVYNGGTKIK